MDTIKILKRAWQILWSYRALWAFGVVLALTISAPFNNPGNNQSRYEIKDSDFNRPGGIEKQFDEILAEAYEAVEEVMSEGLPELEISAQELTTLLWIGVILIFLALLTGLFLTVARFVTETAVIRMVDEHEKTGAKPGIRQGLKYGWSRSALRLAVISFLTNLPVFILGLALLGLIIVVVVIAIQGTWNLSIPIIIGAIGLGFLLLLMMFFLGLLLSILEQFFWRASIVEQLGIRDAFSRGFALAKRNWKPVGLMWLILIGVNILWGIGIGLAAILLIPVLIFTALAGLVAGGVPTLLVAGISSLALDGFLPWIVGAIFGLPLFLVVTFLPLAFVRGLGLLYNSIVWTLTYRELNALPLTQTAVEPSQVE